jgi:tetratricopeptide (TPR) repeat protein
LHDRASSLRSAWAVVLAACAPALHAQPAPEAGLPPVVIQSPHYGDVLFQFFQDDWFDAIVRTEAYRAQGVLGPHETDAELLLGGMYLSFGQHARAADTFRRLLAAPSTPPALRARAWFFLGKTLYARGYFDESVDALGRASGQLAPSMDAERRVLLAQGLMQLGRYEEAARELEGWSGPPDWQAFGQFNLGVALIRAGRTGQGLALLERVGTLDAQTEELRSLRDKANVAIGYANLEAGNPAAARVALERVRLNGPQSNKALLAAGWAASAEDRFEQALVPWTELRDRDLLDSAVQESYLAVPYAYSKLTAEKQAATSYEVAIAAYDGEMRRLQESVEAIRSGRLVKTLADSGQDDGSGTFRDLRSLPDTPETRYLYHLLAGHEFQEALKDYRALGFLTANLGRLADDLDAFAGLVNARRETFATLVPAASSRIEGIDLARVERERDGLQAWLDRARETGDWSLLAEGDEQRLLAMMAGVEAALDADPEDPMLAAARQKARLERGALQWNLDAAGAERSWRTGRDLRRLDMQLAMARERLQTARAALITAPVRNEQLKREVDALRPRLAQVAGRLAEARQRQGDYLAALALAALEAQRARLAEYSAQARYGLAALYDRPPTRVGPRPEGQAP